MKVLTFPQWSSLPGTDGSLLSLLVDWIVGWMGVEISDGEIITQVFCRDTDGRYFARMAPAQFERRLAEVMEGKAEDDPTIAWQQNFRFPKKPKAKEPSTTECDLMRQYAIAAHWWMNASDEELLDFGETRPEALVRMRMVEDDLERFFGFYFGNPNCLSKWGI
jgi:hypothetical protein